MNDLIRYRFVSKLIASFVVMVLCGVFAPPRPVLAESAVESPSATERLAATLGRMARQMLQVQPLTETPIHTASVLLDEAVELGPTDEHLWRLQLELAMLVEDDERKVRAIRRLREIAPDDEVVHFHELQLKIDQHQTATSRMAAYEELLRDDRRESLSPAVASRLAYDLALLHQRLGHTSAFARWLSEAVALDQSHYEAAALAAGFFQDHIEDAFEECELLVNLLLANPINRTSQIRLAGHLLDHGAYAGADRIYRMALATTEVQRVMPESALVSDAALARWGRGDAEGAIRMVRRHHGRLNQLHRNAIRRDRPDIGPVELARHRAILPIDLATTYAVIARSADSEHADRALSELSRSYEQLIEMYEEDARESGNDYAAAIAGAQLEQAWLLFLLDGDIDRARAYIEKAKEYSELSSHAEQRFDGLLALREGSPNRAIELLEPLAKDDVASRAGLAMALEAVGSRRSAARELLALARSDPGMLIGAWSADRLYRLLGQRVPLSTSASQMNELIDTIPASVDRMVDHPRSAVSLRIQPVKSTYDPYDPILLHVEVTNHMPIPLSIGPDAPIQSQIILLPAVEIARVRTPQRLQPIIVPIDRRFRLEPRERLVIPIDMRRYRHGMFQESIPVPGAMMRVRAMLNFRINAEGAIEPGLLGSQNETIVFRIDGVRMTDQWFNDLLDEMTDPDARPNLVNMAMLSHVIGRDPETRVMQDQRRFLRDAREVFAEAFARLPAHQQAWLITAMPRDNLLHRVWQTVHASEDPHVQLAYLIHVPVREDDPVIAAARASDNPNVREIGEFAAHMHERMREEEDLDSLLPPDSRREIPAAPE